MHTMAFRTISRRLLASSSPIFSPSRRRFSGGEIKHPYRYGGRVIYPAGCSYKGECNWIPPHRVASITDERACSDIKEGQSERAVNNYLVQLNIMGTEFDTEQELFHYYIQLLASAVGSEEEAKKKIYLVSCGRTYGFGAQLHNAALERLNKNHDVFCAWDDYNYNTRKKDPKALSLIHFAPVNKNCRLANIFSYHHQCEPNSNWRSDHWLINIKEPDNYWIGDENVNPVGSSALPLQAKTFAPECWIMDICIKMLAGVVGSEEAAKKKIYIIWCKFPFGFGAEIDEATADSLRGLTNVQKVLPDYAFDVKDWVQGSRALYVLPLSHGLRFNHLNDEINSDEPLVSMAYNEDEREYTHSCAAQSVYQFDLIKRNHLLNDLFSYHHLSECNTGWDSDHWLIHIKRRNDGFKTKKQIVDFCIQILAEVIGSHGDAKEKIYVVWCKEPFGFGAEIDELTSNKLKDLPDVTIVLPDYAFDFKNRNYGAVLISPLRDITKGFADIIFRYLDNRDDEESIDDYSNYSDDEECIENYSDDFDAIGDLRDCMEESVDDLHVPTN